MGQTFLSAGSRATPIAPRRSFLLALLALLLAACGVAPRPSPDAAADAILSGAGATATAVVQSARIAQPRPEATRPSRISSPTAPPRKGSARTPTPAPSAVVSPTAGPRGAWATATVPAGPTRIATLSPSAPPHDTATVTLYVDTAALGYEGANLRDRPSTTANLLTVIPNGASVEAAPAPLRGADGADWYAVTYGARRGYILGSLLNLRPPDGASAVASAPAAGTSTPAPDPDALAGFFPVHPANRPDRQLLARLLPAELHAGEITLHFLPGPFSTSDVPAFSRDVNRALRSVQELLDAELAGPVDYYLGYTLFPPPDPGLRGFNRAEERIVYQLYDGSGTRLERQYLAAHELTHQVAADSIGPHSSVFLAEGIAMYASQRYLIADGNVSLDGFARAALEEGRLIPLADLESGRVRFMGRLPQRTPYDQAGSFVRFLIETRGLPRFKDVYVSGQYERVYGETLPQLEAEWKRSLRSPRALGPFAPDPGRYLDDIEAVQAAYARLFAALDSGAAVPESAYRALDAARVAADRADHDAVERGLRRYALAMG